MKKYDEEFQKTVGRNRMAFIATLAVTELMESGKLTKDEIIAFVKKNAEEQKHSERADDLVTFIEDMNSRDYLAQFGWRIFDLKKFYDERKKFRAEIHVKKVAEAEEKLKKAQEEKVAKKAKNKQKNPISAQVQPSTPTPKRRIVVMKKKV